MFLGNSFIGRGVPVDALDRACRSVKQCYRCAEKIFDIMTDSTSCGSNDLLCRKHKQNCNLKFVKSLFEMRNEYNEVFHTSNSKFFHQQDCQERERNQKETSCCGNSESAYVKYRTDKHQCCNGKLRSLSDNC